MEIEVEKNINLSPQWKRQISAQYSRLTIAYRNHLEEIVHRIDLLAFVS